MDTSILSTYLGRRLVVALVAALVVLSTVPGVAAATTQVGGTVVVAEGETVTGGLQAVGGSVIVHGTVEGPLEVVGGSVVVEGAVHGDVRVTGGSVVVAGVVDGDVAASGGSVKVLDGAVIRGDLTVGAGSVFVGGTVHGDAVVGAEEILLGSTAVVDGVFRYDGDLDRREGAVVGGGVVHDRSLGLGPTVLGQPVPGMPDWFGGVYGFAANLLLGAVLLVLFPRFSRGVSDRVATDPLLAGGVGILVLVGVPLGLALVAITIVGIPLSVAGLVGYLLALWVGAVYGRVAVGDWLLDRAGVRHRWGGLLVGMVVVSLLVRVPDLGGVVDLLVLLLGLGALAGTTMDRYRGWSRQRAGVVADERPASGRAEEAGVPRV